MPTPRKTTAKSTAKALPATVLTLPAASTRANGNGQHQPFALVDLSELPVELGTTDIVFKGQSWRVQYDPSYFTPQIMLGLQDMSERKAWSMGVVLDAVLASVHDWNLARRVPILDEGGNATGVLKLEKLPITREALSREKFEILIAVLNGIMEPNTPGEENASF